MNARQAKKVRAWASWEYPLFRFAEPITEAPRYRRDWWLQEAARHQSKAQTCTDDSMREWHMRQEQQAREYAAELSRRWAT